MSNGDPQCKHELYGDGETYWCEWCDYSETVPPDEEPDE